MNEMKYIDLHKQLKQKVNYDSCEIVLDENTVIQNLSFTSKHRAILPGGAANHDTYEYCTPDSDDEADIINKNDAEISENIHFRYHIFYPGGHTKQKHIIFLFHGFNEKYWDKYLTWAKYITNATGKTVILFPIAFHMNRAPHSWSDSHKMFTVSLHRKELHPDVICSTLSNVAISTRLHNKPQRFIWSGLQSYFDVIDLVEQIKKDQHPIIAPDATIDFFAYSIGCLLAEILMMTNKKGYFSESKLCMFCGGAVFNRLSPVTKFILDSEANVSLYSYVVEHLESHMKHNAMLGLFLGESHPEGINFRSMLNYNIFMDRREKKLRHMADRLFALTLSKDTVIPPYEIVNTLTGNRRDIPIRVEILDFPYKYKHEDPFPAVEPLADPVQEAFDKTFHLICQFLR